MLFARLRLNRCHFKKLDLLITPPGGVGGFLHAVSGNARAEQSALPWWQCLTNSPPADVTLTSGKKRCFIDKGLIGLLNSTNEPRQSLCFYPGDRKLQRTEYFLNSKPRRETDDLCTRLTTAEKPSVQCKVHPVKVFQRLGVQIPRSTALKNTVKVLMMQNDT